MKRTIVIGDISVKPGEIGFGKLEGPSLRNSQPVSLPLIVVNGASAGPTLWVEAAIHGLELPGIEVIRRLTREEVDPARLCGTIIGVPTANPYAFQAGVQFAPQDNVDAHAIFPGDPNKSLSYRLAHLIYTEGILNCDYFIDLHSNYWPAIMFLPVPVCTNKDVMQRTLGMAEAFGLPICEVKGSPGWPAARAQVEGKPAMVVELLYHGWVDRHSADVGVKGMLNVIKYLGMVEGKVEALPPSKVPPGWYGREFIYCSKGGIVTPKKDAGDRISAGEVVAVIRDIYGDIAEEVISPADGYVRTVLFGNLNQAVCAGDIMYSYMAIRPKETFFAIG